MNIRKVLPLEICNIIKSYLINEKVNKIEKKLICRECGKEYFGNEPTNQDLCPCYITWLYFYPDYENPWL